MKLNIIAVGFFLFAISAIGAVQPVRPVVKIFSCADGFAFQLRGKQAYMNGKEYNFQDTGSDSTYKFTNGDQSILLPATWSLNQNNVSVLTDDRGTVRRHQCAVTGFQG